MTHEFKFIDINEYLSDMDVAIPAELANNNRLWASRDEYVEDEVCTA